MPRLFFVGGNWKCNGSREANRGFIEELNRAELPTDKVEVVIAPMSLHVESVVRSIRPEISIAVQNVFINKGAFTGELSPSAVKDFGLDWAIIGHSERRQIFGESDEFVGKKVEACLRASLKVIACIGETESERKANKTEEVIFRQLSAIKKELTRVQDWHHIVLAYEPVWAIGTGLTATPDQAQQVHETIRRWLASNVNSDVADTIRIIYGGSVKASNARDLASKKDIDGFLVGGASLVAAEFIEIARSHLLKHSRL
ncbi:hypothetical protein PROFUN_06055 [Planoprotostelium fungivorum]|uniref:Triosephosphate isomerase n=1 Tax=Planoprotostelium fungivorum TaxID=1890364 RepID=A0A2P6NPQ3_9EUKA|nr:hypothetical protein PROFUN_06055 [Planoprotostelium fungivorum]